MSEESNDLVGKLHQDKITFDDVLKELGEFGRYQKLVYFFCCIPYVFLAMLLMGWVFVGANVDFVCKRYSNQTVDEVFLESNFTNVCHLPDEDDSVSKCPRGYAYDRSQIGDSVTMEFDLVCDRKELHATIGASPMFGYLLGGFIFGHISDKFGRKPTLLIANVFLIIGGFSGALAPGYWSFVASRVIVGFAIPGIDLACFVMGMELVGKSKRTLAGIVCWFFETAGYLVALALVLIINSNWRLLLAMYTLPSLFIFTYKWIVPESPRWLVSQGRSEEAAKILMTTAKVNKVHLSSELLRIATTPEDDSNSSDNHSILDLFRYRNMRYKTLILMCTWLICPAMYYILLLDQTELSDNRYVGFLMTTLVQLPGYIYVLATLERPAFGRKRSLCGFLIMTGICLFCHPLVPSGSKFWVIVQVSVSIVGRFCANCSYTVLGLYSSELFPTVVRSTGLGFTIVVSRVGTILAPYLLLLGSYASLILGVSSFTAGTLALMLPETLGHGLPETLEDGEKISLVYPKFLVGKKTDRDSISDDAF